MNSIEQKKHGYQYHREDLYTVIIFCATEIWQQSMAPRDQLYCLKYRNIAVDKPAILEVFNKFIRKEFPNAKYMNVYGGVSGDYYKRVYF
jgi:hypothetical protein